MNELNEMFDKYIKLKSDVNNINVEINRKKVEFDNSIKHLYNDLFLKKVELDAINDYKVSIRFGDLIDELIDLFNFNKDVDSVNYNITTNLCLDGKRNIHELIKLDEDSKYSKGYRKSNLNILLEGTKKTARYSYQPRSFMYSLFLPLDFSAIQADGKSLLDHSSVLYKKENNKKTSSIVINKNVEDLVLNIDMNTLMSINKPSFFPANIFRDAVSNCLSKDKILIKKRQP